jgi:hypothetical protein
VEKKEYICTVVVVVVPPIFQQLFVSRHHHHHHRDHQCTRVPLLEITKHKRKIKISKFRNKNGKNMK